MSGRDVDINVSAGFALVLIFMGLCNGAPDIVDAWGARLANVPLAEYMTMRDERVAKKD